MKIEIKKINRKNYKSELPILLNLLPKWRLEKAKSYKFDIDKYLCAKSFLLLQEMLFKEYNIESIPPFSYEANGKPYFKEYREIHFNISHCKSAIACVVNNEAIGIDIEEIYFDKDIAENILSKKECNEVFNSEFSAKEFIKYWTMKESYLKLSGVGLVDNVQNILENLKSEVQFETLVDKKNRFITTVAMWKMKH